MSRDHTLTLEAQPIADQWMGKCACGWRTTASVYEYPNRDALIAEIKRQHVAHVAADEAPQRQSSSRAETPPPSRRAPMSRLTAPIRRLTFPGGKTDRAPPTASREPHWKAWYKTARWQKLRREVLERDGYICQRTGAICAGKHPAPNSPVVNHKRPHRGNETLFWDIDNLETVTKAEHDAAIQREEQASRHQVGTWD